MTEEDKQLIAAYGLLLAINLLQIKRRSANVVLGRMKMNRVKQPNGSIKYVTHDGSEFGSLAEALEWEACLDWAWVDELEEQTKLKGGSKYGRKQSGRY